MFDTNTSCEEKPVFVTNNAESKCIGMGTMKIKMFDGIIRTLMNLMRVLNLKRDFISLGGLRLQWLHVHYSRWSYEGD